MQSVLAPSLHLELSVYVFFVQIGLRLDDNDDDGCGGGDDIVAVFFYWAINGNSGSGVSLRARPIFLNTVATVSHGDAAVWGASFHTDDFISRSAAPP